MNVFKRLLMLSGGGTSVPYDYPDKFAFFADQAVVEPSILEVLRPSDRLGDFTVVRGSSATYVDSDGIIKEALDNVARIDYTNGAAELLTEPQSTNLIPYSEDFSDFSWNSGTNCDFNPSIEIAPDGVGTFTELSSVVATNGDHRARLASAGMSINTSYTASIFVKKKDVQYYYFRDLANGAISVIDIDTEEITLQGAGHTVKVTDFNNGVKKIDVSFATVGTISNNILDFGMTSLPTNYVSIISINDGMYIWGAQLEALPYATSYIPTNGSTVTRLQDVITDGGNVNVINSEEGVLFFEGSALFDDTGENRYLSLSDGTENNVINISYNTTGALIQFLINAGGALILTHAQPAVDITTNAKIAVKWKVNDFAIWINGVEVDAVLSGVVPTGLNSVNLSNAIGANYFNSRTRELRIADRALTDEELENLTTL